MTDYADLRKRLDAYVADIESLGDDGEPAVFIAQAADALAALVRERDEALKATVPGSKATMLSLADGLNEARRDLEEARDVLRMAAKTFRKYERLHRDKRTVEGATKANSNMIIAQLCERAARLSPPPSVEGSKEDGEPS